MKECATIDYRLGKLFFSTKSSGPGAYIGIGHPQVLDEASPSQQIGTALIFALSLSRPNKEISFPEDFSTISSPLLQAAGVKTWKEFAHGCKAMRAERINNRVELQPLKREGTNFVLGSKPEILENPTPEELGTIIQQLFRIKKK